MTEGTKSYLIGCHQFFLHPLFVLKGWRQEYGTWPTWWQAVGIFCHDVGVCGRMYLSDDSAKTGHWRAGAELSRKIVSCVCQALKLPPKRRVDLMVRVYLFCAGHCPEESGFLESPLSRADKRSWLSAPIWWEWVNYYVEWHGKGIGVTPPPVWRKVVEENLRREKPIGNHQLYIRTRR